MVPRLQARAGSRRWPRSTEPQDAPVIIAGFGRYGQIVGRMLFANGMRATVLDHDAEQVEAMRRFGWRVYYGDATRLDLLRMAGAAKARVLVRGDRRHRAERRVARRWRASTSRNCTIVARARNVAALLRSCASSACD